MLQGLWPTSYLKRVGGGKQLERLFSIQAAGTQKKILKESAQPLLFGVAEISQRRKLQRKELGFFFQDSVLTLVFVAAGKTVAIRTAAIAVTDGKHLHFLALSVIRAVRTLFGTLNELTGPHHPSQVQMQPVGQRTGSHIFIRYILQIDQISVIRKHQRLYGLAGFFSGLKHIRPGQLIRKIASFYHYVYQSHLRPPRFLDFQTTMKI